MFPSPRYKLAALPVDIRLQNSPVLPTLTGRPSYDQIDSDIPRRKRAAWREIKFMSWLTNHRLYRTVCSLALV